MRRASAASRCICAVSASREAKCCLIAQLRHELHLDLATVEVAGEIEHVRLQQRLARRPPSGACPRLATPGRRLGSRCRARAPRTRRPPARAGARAAGWRWGTRAFRPRRSPGTTRPRIAQGRPSQLARAREVRGRQGGAHPAAADALAREHHRRARTSTSNPSVRPACASTSAVAVPWRPKRKSCPTTIGAGAELTRQKEREILAPTGYAKPHRSAAGTGSPAAGHRGGASARAGSSGAPADRPAADTRAASARTSPPPQGPRRRRPARADGPAAPGAPGAARRRPRW